MSTSGIAGTVRLRVIAALEDAFKLCGVPPSVISGEQLQTSFDILQKLLYRLSNRGVNLWRVDQKVFPFVPGQIEYLMPVQVLDQLKCFNRLCTFTAGALVGSTATASYSGGAKIVSGVAVVPSVSGTVTYMTETSDDGATWRFLANNTVKSVTAGSEIAFDFHPTRFSNFVRTTGPLTAARFVTDTSQIEMTAFSRDVYSQLPNPYSTSERPLQVWPDKQYDCLHIYIWPCPSPQVSGQLLVYAHNYIQDNLTYVDDIDVPQRWQQYIELELASILSLNLPAAILPQGRSDALQTQALMALKDSEDGETDHTPVMITPNIGMYTR